MKHFILILIFVFLAFTCGNSNRENEAINSNNDKPMVLKSGIVAKTSKDVALWSEQELKVLEGPNWSKAKAGIKLKTDVPVFIIDMENKYAKVKTIIGIEGFIVKDLLIPFSHNENDSLRYYDKKKIVRINTIVDGLDVGTVKLWQDKENRDNLVDQVSKGEKVALLNQDGEFVKVLTVNNTQGWCMKGFIK